MQAHEVLGVRPGATRKEIVQGFRRFALRNHPDRGGDAARFQAGVEAYERLTGTRPDPQAAAAVLHRRLPAGVSTLLRMAGRRLTAFRSRP